MKGIQQINSVNDLLSVIFVVIIFSILYYILYRKYVISIFDPMFFFVITIIFSSAMMILLVRDYYYLIQFFLFQFFFWLGIASFNIDKEIVNIKVSSLSFNKDTIVVLEIVTIILFFIVLAANFYSAYVVGITLFSDSPTISKVANFEGGLGFIRRINWGISVFVSCSSLVLVFVSKHKNWFLFILLIQVIITLLAGSKSAMLNVATIYVCLSKHKMFNYRVKFKLDKKSILILVSFAVLFGLYILQKESEKATNPMILLVGKFYLNGDVINYFYRSYNINYFESKDFFDYVYNLFNPVLGLLRIVPYEEPYGYLMVKNYFMHSLPQLKMPTTLGPNNLFFIDGFIHFGLIGGMIYSYLVGFIISFVRKRYYQYNGSDLITLVLLFVLFIEVTSLAQESSYFTGKVFDTFFIPLILLSVFLLIFRAIRHVNIKDKQS